jgi:hypothetical protein
MNLLEIQISPMCNPSLPSRFSGSLELVQFEGSLNKEDATKR